MANQPKPGARRRRVIAFDDIGADDLPAAPPDQSVQPELTCVRYEWSGAWRGHIVMGDNSALSAVVRPTLR